MKLEAVGFWRHRYVPGCPGRGRGDGISHRRQGERSKALDQATHKGCIARGDQPRHLAGAQQVAPAGEPSLRPRVSPTLSSFKSPAVWLGIPSMTCGVQVSLIACV